MSSLLLFEGNYIEACKAIKAGLKFDDDKRNYVDASAFLEESSLKETEEAIIKDLHRTHFYSRTTTLGEMKRRWLSEAKHHAYTQGSFVAENLTTPPVLCLAHESEQEHFEIGAFAGGFSIAYLNESGRPCGFSVAYDKLDKSKFLVAHIHGTTSSPEERTVKLIGRSDYFFHPVQHQSIIVNAKERILSGILDKSLREKVKEIFDFPTVGKINVNEEKLEALNRELPIGNNVYDWTKSTLEALISSLNLAIQNKERDLNKDFFEASEDRENKKGLLALVKEAHKAFLIYLENWQAGSYTDMDEYFSVPSDILKGQVKRIEALKLSSPQSLYWHTLALGLEETMLKMARQSTPQARHFFEALRSSHQDIEAYFNIQLDEAMFQTHYQRLSKEVQAFKRKQSLLEHVETLSDLKSREGTSHKCLSVIESLFEETTRLLSVEVSCRESDCERIREEIESLRLARKKEGLVAKLMTFEKNAKVLLGEDAALYQLIQLKLKELDESISSSDELSQFDERLIQIANTIKTHKLIALIESQKAKLDAHILDEKDLISALEEKKKAALETLGDDGLSKDISETEDYSEEIKNDVSAKLHKRKEQILNYLVCHIETIKTNAFVAAYSKSHYLENWARDFHKKACELHQKIQKSWDNQARGDDFSHFYDDIKVSLQALRAKEEALNEQLDSIKEALLSPLIHRLTLMREAEKAPQKRTFSLKRKESILHDFVSEASRLHGLIDEELERLTTCRRASDNLIEIINVYVGANNTFKRLFREDPLIKASYERNKTAHDTLIKKKERLQGELEDLNKSYLEEARHTSIWKRRKERIATTALFAITAVAGLVLFATAVLSLVGIILLGAGGGLALFNFIGIVKKENELQKDISKHIKKKSEKQQACDAIGEPVYTRLYGIENDEEETRLRQNTPAISPIEKRVDADAKAYVCVDKMRDVSLQDSRKHLFFKEFVPETQEAEPTLASTIHETTL